MFLSCPTMYGVLTAFKEIPDAEADEITTVPQAIEYIAKTPEGTYHPL